MTVHFDKKKNLNIERSKQNKLETSERDRRKPQVMSPKALDTLKIQLRPNAQHVTEIRIPISLGYLYIPGQSFMILRKKVLVRVGFMPGVDFQLCVQATLYNPWQSFMIL